MIVRAGKTACTPRARLRPRRAGIDISHVRAAAIRVASQRAGRARLAVVLPRQHGQRNIAGVGQAAGPPRGNRLGAQDKGG